MNEMKTKCLLFITITLIGLSNLFAQPDFSNPILNECCSDARIHMDSIINNAPFIFEGKLIESDNQSYKANEETCFRSYLFEVEKVYRGGTRIKEGTVEVIVTRSINSAYSYSQVGFGFDTWHILLCKETKISGIYNASNELKFELFYNEDRYFSCIRECKRIKNGELKDRNPYYTGLSVQFETRYGVRKFFKKYGLTPEKPQPSPKLKSSEPKQLQIEKSPYYKTKQEKKEWVEKLEKQKHILDSISNQNLKKIKQTEIN